MHRSTLIAASVGLLTGLVSAQVSGYGQCKPGFYKRFGSLMIERGAELGIRGALSASQAACPQMTVSNTSVS
jgi:hypothetical protein